MPYTLSLKDILGQTHNATDIQQRNKTNLDEGPFLFWLTSASKKLSDTLEYGWDFLFRHTDQMEK